MIRMWNRIHWLTFTRNKLHFGTFGFALVAVGEAISSTNWVIYRWAYTTLTFMIYIHSSAIRVTLIGICQPIFATHRIIIVRTSTRLQRLLALPR